MRLDVLVLALAACGPAAPSADKADTATAGADTVDDVGNDAAVTFHRDVRPVLDKHCTSCHVEGGIGPFSMAYDAAEWAKGPAWWADSAVRAVAAGTMPPWNPSDDCHPLQGSRRLPDELQAVLAEWADLGFPEGREDTYVSPVAATLDALGPPSIEAGISEPYVPDRSQPDDYRCFPLDIDTSESAWITAFTVAPDKAALVHHAILYRLDASDAEDVKAWDEADDGLGYTCFGSPGTWRAETLAGWAPGGPPEVYAEGTARAVPAGSVLVLQMHYNVLNFGPDEAIPADATGIKLWTLPEGEMPDLQLLSVPLAKTDLSVPKGDPAVVQTEAIDLDWLPRRLPLRGVFPHMHQLGTTLRVDVVRADGTEDCVVDIPEWDFNWQQAYFFPEDEAIGLGRDDEVRIRCGYDNSAANQAVVNGVQMEPRDVEWGDRTEDEMCLAYLYVTCPAGSCPSAF